MNELKLQELKNRTSIEELSKLSSISTQGLYKILKGKYFPRPEIAKSLAMNACLLTKLDIYEPHDFNPNLSPALKNLCDDVKFIITDLKRRSEERGTVVELLEEHPDDLELLQAFFECVWDGVPVLIHGPSRLIELDDFLEPDDFSEKL